MTNVNQSETNAIPLDDTRKKLWADCEDLIRRIQERIFSGRDKTALRCQFAELLDRQAAITEREAIERWDGKALALYVDAESARKALAEECDEWERACDKVKAERDEFQEKLEAFEGDCYCGATVVEWHKMACNLQGKVEELQSALEAKEQLERDSAYMRLPVDADGVPIRPGDILEDAGTPRHVCGIGCSEIILGGYPQDGEQGMRYALPCNHRHVKPDTVESLLQQLADEVWEASCTCQTTWSDSGLDGIAERYAERIRKAVDNGD